MVSESIPLHTYILTVEATDIDSYDNSRLYFYLSGDGHQDFSIDPITGKCNVFLIDLFCVLISKLHNI